MSTTHNDPSKGSGLTATKRRTVGLDDDAPNGIGGERKSVAPEPVDRDCNLHMLQEGSQPIRIIGIVAPRCEVEPHSARLDNRVIRGTGLLSSSAGNLVCAPVLRSAMERHQTNRRSQLADLLDSRPGQEFGQTHDHRLACGEVLRVMWNRLIVPAP